MKVILNSIFVVFAITAFVTHIWTTIIAFNEAGMFAGVVSMFLPLLAELFWMFKMFGVNNTYAYIALSHLILSILFSINRR